MSSLITFTDNIVVFTESKKELTTHTKDANHATEGIGLKLIFRDKRENDLDCK